MNYFPSLFYPGEILFLPKYLEKYISEMPMYCKSDGRKSSGTRGTIQLKSNRISSWVNFDMYFIKADGEEEKGNIKASERGN